MDEYRRQADSWAWHLRLPVFWKLLWDTTPVKVQELGQYGDDRENQKRNPEGCKETGCVTLCPSCPRQTLVGNPLPYVPPPDSWSVCHPNLSFSAACFHLTCNFLTSCHQHFGLNHSNHTLTRFLFYFVVLPVMLSSLHHSFTLRSILPPSVFECEPISLTLFLDSPSSSHISKATLPTSQANTYFYQWTCQTFSALCFLVCPVSSCT